MAVLVAEEGFSADKVDVFIASRNGVLVGFSHYRTAVISRLVIVTVGTCEHNYR